MILQQHIPYDATEARRLPGVQPLADRPWLIADDAFGAQMAERDRLLAERPREVIDADPGARPAIEELFETVLANLPEGFACDKESVRRPDGVTVPLDRNDPMGSLGRLVQEDLCVMEKRGGEEHVLTAAVLCFPARWRLSDKMMRPLTAIHAPVEPYDDALARRVQRLFDGLQTGRPIWRYNELWTADPRLFQPDPPARLPKWANEEPEYLRSERQVLMRLPETRAVVFSIHTYMLARADVPGEMVERVY